MKKGAAKVAPGKGIRLSQLGQSSRSLTVVYDGQEIGVRYRPAFATAEIEDALATMTARPLGTLVDVMERALVDWDVLGEDGEPLPVTRENLRRCPSDFLAAIQVAINEDQQPGEGPAPTSPSG